MKHQRQNDAAALIDERIPDRPGVYLICNERPYYVGASKNMRFRLRQHISRLTQPGRHLCLGATAYVLEVVEDLDWLGSREALWAFRMKTGQTVVSYNNWRNERKDLK